MKLDGVVVEGLIDLEAMRRAELDTFALLEDSVRRARRLYGEALAGAGLTVREFLVLSKVRDFGTVRQSILAERLVLSRQRAHQLVAQLEREGSLHVQRDERRTNAWLTLTLDGRGRLEEGDEALRAVRKGLMRRFGTQQQAALRGLLDDLQDAIQLWRSDPGLFQE